MTKYEISTAIDLSKTIRYTPSDLYDAFELFGESNLKKEVVHCTPRLAAVLVKYTCRTLNGGLRNKDINRVVPYLKKYVRVYSSEGLIV